MSRDSTNHAILTRTLLGFDASDVCHDSYLSATRHKQGILR